MNYFTDSAEMANSYSPSGEKFSGYLNITNPYIIDAKSSKWSSIPIDDETKRFLDERGSSTFKENGIWRSTPADIVSAIEEAVDDGELNYDGVIILNVDDTGSYSKSGKHIVANDYIAFNSNQFKNADNKNPTSNPDIRLALTGNEDIDAMFAEIGASADGANFDVNKILERGIPRKPGASTITIGEMKKTIANNTHYRVFSKGKALDVIGKMFGTSDLTAKTRGKLADALWQGFNDCTDVESRQTFARDMAEYIVATMVTEAKVENPDVMEAQERLSYLSTYIGIM